MFTPRTREQLPEVNEVVPETAPRAFREKLEVRLKSRQQGSEKEFAAYDEEDELDDIPEETVAVTSVNEVNLEAEAPPTPTRQSFSSSFKLLRKASNDDGRSSTSKSSISSRISQLGKLMKPACFNPSIVGDKTVWDLQPDTLCELIATLRGGSSFKIVQRAGQPSLQLIEPTESILMTSYRPLSAPSLIETAFEIVFKQQAYQASMKVPISALRLLQEATLVSPAVWIDCFCVNIADSLQARFKSLFDAKQRAELFREWEGQGLDTTESLRQVLIASMYPLYCRHRTFLGPSVVADERYLLAGWALQESLYNDIVLKLVPEDEYRNGGGGGGGDGGGNNSGGGEEEDVIEELRKKEGRLNATGAAVLRRRAALGTNTAVSVAGGYAHVTGSLTPDRMERVLGLLRRVYWKVQLSSEALRDRMLFAVLRERGLVTPADAHRLHQSLPSPHVVNLSLGTTRLHPRWLSLHPDEPPQPPSGSAQQPGARAGGSRTRMEGGASSRSQRVELRAAGFQPAAKEELARVLGGGADPGAGLASYSAEVGAHAPVCARTVEVWQCASKHAPGVVYRRLRVLDSDGVQVHLSERKVAVRPPLPDAHATPPAPPPPPDTRWCIVQLPDGHVAGDTYLFWVTWDGDKDKAGAEVTPGEGAVAIHIAASIEEDFKELSLSQAPTP